MQATEIDYRRRRCRMAKMTMMGDEQQPKEEREDDPIVMNSGKLINIALVLVLFTLQNIWEKKGKTAFQGLSNCLEHLKSHSSQKWNNLKSFRKVESGKMIFTLYYMYATFIQWWRLGSLRNKLSGTLNSHNAILVCSETVVYDTKKSRSFENLLFRNEERIGCTIVPRIETFGELVGWRAADYFEAVLKTDMDKLAKLVHCYSQGNIDINHELKLLKIETIDVEGIPTRIKYEKKFSTDFILKYSHSPVHWKQFTETVKELYSKIRDSTNPKITIENGKSDEIRKVPISEVKPIKKTGSTKTDTPWMSRLKSGGGTRPPTTRKKKPALCEPKRTVGMKHLG
nr:unnamed protein product [Callosobruchus analis]